MYVEFQFVNYIKDFFRKITTYFTRIQTITPTVVHITGVLKRRNEE